MRTTRAVRRPRGGEGPVSVRLEAALREEIQSLARRTGKPLSRLIKELLEIALRMQRFPGVIFVEGPAGRRAHVAGTGLDVWEVIELLKGYDTAANLVEHFPNLSKRAVHMAEAYAKAYPQEIEAFLQFNARSPEDLKREFPWLEAPRS